MILLFPQNVFAEGEYKLINPSIEKLKELTPIVHAHKFKIYKYSYVTKDFQPSYECTNNVDHYMGKRAIDGKAWAYSGSCYTSTTRAKEIVPKVQTRLYRTPETVDRVAKQKAFMLAQEKVEQEKVDDMIQFLKNKGYSITK